MDQLLITRIAWTGYGVDAFTEEVNEYLDEGWVAQDVRIEKKGLRFVCLALLVDYSQVEKGAVIVDAPSDNA
jgi:hypothetical protein